MSQLKTFIQNATRRIFKIKESEPILSDNTQEQIIKKSEPILSDKIQEQMIKKNIQNLPRKQQIYRKIDSDEYKKYLMRTYKINKEDFYFFKDTNNEQPILHPHYDNNFLGSFLFAYNNHGDIVLNPDDMWLMVSLYFSKYVDSNAKKLREKFVKHNGQKELIVYTTDDSVDSSIKQWENFFSQIIDQIKVNTLPDVVDELMCNFSTSTPTHKLISSAIIMNSFKQYFSYGRMICSCGINNIYFEGNRDDWEKLIKKTSNLSKYDVNGVLLSYIEKIIIIFTEFLKTFDGEKNVDFWNRIMTTELERIGSGGQTQTNIKGWILDFYGISGWVPLDNVPSYNINVPIKMTNEITKQTINLELIGGWSSIKFFDEYIYKPIFGVCLIKEGLLKSSFF
jgi:hypothetical protein